VNDRATFAKIRSVIFDMDGVVTSEEDYWLAAELTVLELLYSKQFIELRNDVLRTVLFKPGRAVALERYVSPNFVAAAQQRHQHQLGSRVLFRGHVSYRDARQGARARGCGRHPRTGA
jgi:phosphoglycolate phosphatase-like HAD superfamily hydrolase